MTGLIVLASVTAYLWIARTVTGRAARRYAAYHEKTWPSLTRDAADKRKVRAEALMMGRLAGLFWPVTLLVWGLFTVLTSGEGPKFPSEIVRERDEMQVRIAELERELEIGR